MNYIEIIRILSNAGFKFKNPSTDGINIFLEDPSCLTSTFETFFDYAWVVASLVTAMLLFGWGIAAIRNPQNGTLGVVSKNFRNLFIIFCTFAAVKPIVNFIWGDDIFSKACGTITLSVADIQKQLIENGFDDSIAYESLEITFSQTGQLSATYSQDANATSQATVSPMNVSYSNSTATYSQDANAASSVQAYKGIRIFQMPDGSKEVRKKNGRHGSRSWLNNNPGNIRHTPFMVKCGAIGRDDKGFAIFPNETTGWQALKRLLRGSTYKGKTIIQAMHTYAPWADNNNPDRYAKHIQSITGLDVNRVVGTLNDTELNAMMKAIQRVEGWTEGIIERQ